MIDQNAPVITDEDQDTINVGAEVEAGNLELNPVREARDRYGRPRIDLAPTTVMPKSGGIRPKDIRPKQLSDFEKEAVEARKQEEAMDFNTWASSITTQNKTETIAGIPITPEVIAQSESDIALRANLIGLYETSRPSYSGVAFETQAGEFDVGQAEKVLGDQYAANAPQALRNQAARTALNNQLKEQNIPEEVRNLIVGDILQYGSIGNEVTNRLKEAGRFLGVTLPDLAFTKIKPAAVAAYKTGALPGSPAFNAEYDLQLEEWKKGYFNWKRDVVDMIPAADLANGFNETIHKKLEDQFEGDEYESLAFMRLPNGEFVVDEQGQKVKKEFVTPEFAYDMLDSTYDSLSYWQRFGVDVTEEAVWAFTTGPVATARGASRVNKVLKYKESPKYKAYLKNVDDPEDILNIVNSHGAKEKADDYFNIGLVQYRTDQEMSYLNTRIKELEGELTSLNRSGKTDTDLVDAAAYSDPDIAEVVTLTANKYRNRLTAEINQLRQTRTRSMITGKVFPYVKDVGESALIIGTGTHLFREHGFFFEDPETREMVGNLFMSLGGYRLGYGGKALGKKVLSAGARGTQYAVPSIFEMGREIASSIPLVGPIAVNKTIQNLESALDQPLTNMQRDNIKNILKMHENLPPNLRKKSIQAMEETGTIYDRIVSEFAPEDQAMIGEKLLSTYGNSSGILTLAAAGELNRGKIDINTLSKYDLEDMENDLTRMEDNFTLATEALAVIKGKTIDIDSTAGRQIVEEWVAAREAGLSKLRTSLREINASRLQKLDDLEDYVIKNSGAKLDEGLLESFNSFRAELAKFSGQPYDSVQSLERQSLALEEAIDSSLKRAAKFRDTPYHDQSVNKAVETLMEAHQSRVRVTGNNIYAPLKELAKKQGPVDLKPLVDTLREGRQVGGIKRFFGESSVLYLGHHGTMTYNAMENILHQQFSRDAIEELRGNLMETYPSDAKKFDSMSDLDLMSEIMDSGDFPDFNPFMVADPYDLEILRRGFERAASGYLGTDPALYATFKDFSRGIDTILEKQNPKYFEEVKKTRKAYETAVGLPTTEKLYLDKFRDLQLRRTPAEKLMGGMSLKSVYADKKPPVEIFSDLRNQIVDALLPEKVKAGTNPQVNLRNSVNNLTYSLGTYRDGSIAFDLSTDTGKVQFEQLRGVLEEMMYPALGENFLKKYSKVEEIGKPAGLKGGRGNLLNDAIDVTETIRVPVFLDDSSKTTMIPLLDVVDAVTLKVDLTKALEDSPEMANKYKQLGSDFTSFKRNTQRDIDLKKQQEADDLKLVEDSARLLGAGDFMDRFVFGAEGGELATLKQRVMEVMIASGKSAEEAEDSFKTVALFYMVQGIYEKGGVGAVAGRVSTRAKGARVSEAIFKPEDILRELQKPAVKQQFLEVMDGDHLTFIEDIMQYMNDSTYAVNIRGATGDFGGLGYSSMISRVWNGVRGVVSPVYIATEYALVAAKAGQIDLLKMTLQNKDAAQLLHKFMKTPNLVGTQDLKKFDNIVKNFLFTELSAEGQQFMITGEGALETPGGAVAGLFTEESNEENE